MGYQGSSTGYRQVGGGLSGDVAGYNYASLVEANADKDNREHGEIGNIPTGVVQLHDTGSAKYWIPKYVADQGIPIPLGYFSGASLPSVEDANFSEGGTGTISSDGTYLNLLTSVGAENITVSRVYTEAAPDIIWLDCLATWNSMAGVINAAGANFVLYNGVRQYWVTIEGTVDPFQYRLYQSNSSTNVVGESGYMNNSAIAPDLTVEHRLTIIADSRSASGDTIIVQVNGVTVCQGRGTLFSASANKSIAMGDSSGSGKIDLDVREFTCGLG